MYTPVENYEPCNVNIFQVFLRKTEKPNKSFEKRIGSCEEKVAI